MGWKVKRRARHALIEVDEVNPLIHRGTFNIGPRHVKHHASKEFVEHAYVENPDFASEQNCRVFAQNSNIAIEVYDFYNKLFDPDYENISVYDERFEVQYLFKETPKETWRSVDYYNPRIEVISLTDGVDIRKTFDTDYGVESLEITYTVKTGARLKHTIVFTNKTAEQKTFRVVMKLSGITSDKVKHGQIEEKITKEKHIVAPVMFFGEDNQNLKLSEYLWSLGEEGEELGEWFPITLKDIVLDVHAQGCKADIIIGNYTLAEDENLLIDPATDTWRVSANTDDVYRRLTPSYWSMGDNSLGAGSYNSSNYEYGCGMRFKVITVPKDATISSAYLIMTAWGNRAGTVCRTRVSAEDVDDAPTFADNAAAFDARWANRTTARINWDGIAGWTDDTEYPSPDIKTVIAEITTRGGWSANNDIVLFWEDFEDRSDDPGLRLGTDFTGNPAQAAQLEITWVTIVVPTVTTQAATNVEDTSATGNGNITATGGENCDERGFVWDLASHGDPGNVAPGASGYANNPHEHGAFGVGAFSLAMPGLPTGDIIYYRAYAHNSAGYDYGAEQNFLTKPAAPTNVQATDGVHTDKVVITWTKSTGATGYQVYRDGGGLGWLGDVATHDDAGADPPIITPGVASASDGTSKLHVVLSLAGESVVNGTTHAYKVRARNATGESDDSAPDNGHRGHGALTYQWQRSAADADAAYGNIGGATTDPYNDVGGVIYPDGRWYLCLLDATGAAQGESTHNRGYRILEVAKTWDIDTAFALLGIEKTPDFDTAFQLQDIEKTPDFDTLFVLRPELQRQLDAAFQRLGIEKTPDFDVAFQRTWEKTPDFDTAFQLQDIEKMPDVDAAFQLQDIQKTPDFDALFVLRPLKTPTIDAAFQLQDIEKTPDIDVAFQLKGIEKTPDIDALFMLRTELARQFDALFKALGVEKTPDFDAAFQATIEKTPTLDALFVLRLELARQIDAAFQLTVEKTPDLDALFVLRLEIQRQIDAAFQLQGIEKTPDFDTAFQLSLEIQRQLDAAFRRLGIEKTPDFDAAFQLQDIERPADVDAAFQLQDIEKTPDFDTVFQRTFEKTPDFDALFMLRLPIARLIDVIFQRIDTERSFGLDVRFIIRRFILTHLTSDEVEANLVDTEVEAGLTDPEVEADLTDTEAEAELVSDEVVVRIRA